MLTDRETLRRLRAASRGKPKARKPKSHRLRCPDCGGDIELRDRRYHCLGAPGNEHPPGSPTSFGSLVELAIGEAVS
ncbi:MAG TPA: hypothetical protein VGK73_38805 [Polyangiaceae bacterium]